MTNHTFSSPFFLLELVSIGGAEPVGESVLFREFAVCCPNPSHTYLGVCLFSRCPRAVTGGYLGSGPPSGEHSTWSRPRSRWGPPKSSPPPSHLIIWVNKESNRLSSRPSSKLLLGNDHSVAGRREPVQLIFITILILINFH